MKRREFIKLVSAGTIGVIVAAHLPAAASALPGEQLLAGDVFTIQGVFAVNPITRLTTPHLQQFVITSTVTSDDQEIDFWPKVDFANLTARPADVTRLRYPQ